MFFKLASQRQPWWEADARRFRVKVRMGPTAPLRRQSSPYNFLPLLIPANPTCRPHLPILFALWRRSWMRRLTNSIGSCTPTPRRTRPWAWVVSRQAKPVAAAYLNRYTRTVPPIPPALEVRFYSTNQGREPVREWLKSLPPEVRKAIGEDLKTV